MYVRFGQVLCQIEEIEDNYISFDRDFYDHWNELTYSMNYDRFINDYKPKASYNIIDLIEVGDYVNGYKVDFVQDGYVVFNHNHPYQLNIYPKDIKSIITKEQFESMSYKVGE